MEEDSRPPVAKNIYALPPRVGIKILKRHGAAAIAVRGKSARVTRPRAVAGRGQEPSEKTYPVDLVTCH